MNGAGTSRERATVDLHVRRVVAEVLGVGPGDLGPAVSLVDDLAADSLDLVEIGLGLEASLGVSMPDEVLQGVRTYGDLVTAVRRVPRDPTGPEARLVTSAANGLVAVLERTAGRVRALATAVSVEWDGNRRSRAHRKGAADETRERTCTM